MEAVTIVSNAVALIGSSDPHTRITDLSFEITGPRRAVLVQFIEKAHPWIGKEVNSIWHSGAKKYMCLQECCPMKLRWLFEKMLIYILLLEN